MRRLFFASVPQPCSLLSGNALTESLEGSIFMRTVSAVPPAGNFMESARSIGYSLEAAVADIIDNSISAGARCIEVQFPRKMRPFLTIIDDGEGMDGPELKQAMVYGSRPISAARSSADLGRFGLGLKLASLSQCRRLTVACKDAQGIISAARWDLDYVKKTDGWELMLLDDDEIEGLVDIEKLRNRRTGTLVIWEELDQLLLAYSDFEGSHFVRKTSDVSKHLSLVFHKFIEEDGVEIRFNGAALEARNPFVRAQEVFAPERLRVLDGFVDVRGWMLRPVSQLTKEELDMLGDLTEAQGFYVYRSRRLVIWGSWFRLRTRTDASRLARIEVNIPSTERFDRAWCLDVKKSSAVLPPEIRQALRLTVDRLQSRSRRSFARVRTRECSPEGFWLRIEEEGGSVSYGLNMNSEPIRRLLAKAPEARSILKTIAATLPVNSIYADSSDNKIFSSLDALSDQDRQVLESLGATDEMIDHIRKLCNVQFNH